MTFHLSLAAAARRFRLETGSSSLRSIRLDKRPWFARGFACQKLGRSNDGCRECKPIVVPPLFGRQTASGAHRFFRKTFHFRASFLGRNGVSRRYSPTISRKLGEQTLVSIYRHNLFGE